MKRNMAAIWLSMSLGLMLLAWLGTLHVDRHAAHHIWPIHSTMFIPLLLAIFAWIALVFFLLVVIAWLIQGDKE